MARPSKESRTWQQAADAYLSAPQTKALRSINDIRVQLVWTGRAWGKKQVVKIDRPAIVSLMDSKQAQGATGATLNRYASTIRRVLFYALERAWIPVLPLMPHFREIARAHPMLSAEQETALLAELPEYIKPLFRFALATGLRKRNLTHLEWDRVDLETRYARIEGDQAKAGRRIGVPLNDEALAVLQERFKDPDKHVRWVFHRNGHPIMQPAGVAWQSAVKRAGLKGLRWHDLRSVWASRHGMAGTPPSVLKELGGWATVSMVERYITLAPGYAAQFVENSRVLTK